MNYKEAMEVVKNSSHLKNVKSKNEITITNIIIVPSNLEHQMEFIDKFYWNDDSFALLLPYVDEDLEVWGIDEIYFRKTNTLVFKKLH